MVNLFCSFLENDIVIVYSRIPRGTSFFVRVFFFLQSAIFLYLAGTFFVIVEDFFPCWELIFSNSRKDWEREGRKMRSSVACRSKRERETTCGCQQPSSHKKLSYANCAENKGRALIDTRLVRDWCK